MTRFLMGNEAIALGAMRAGVRVVTGYPGTPSTEILETIAKENDGSIYVEWSVNEKAALEVAAGAAYAGARTLVTMKQVGLNVASDPLMSLNYVGVKGGMVIVSADDPGPISSQTEQDTRHYAQFAKIAVFDPASPEEAYEMIAAAFEYSEKYGKPVLFRPTTRVCHGCAPIKMLPNIKVDAPEGFIKDSRWVIFPKLSYESHLRLEQMLKDMSKANDVSEFNAISGEGEYGIAVGGVNTAYAAEALSRLGAKCKVLKIGSYPFPYGLAEQFLKGLKEVLVIEELDPVIERELMTLCAQMGVTLKGKLSGHMPAAGENSVAIVEKALAEFLHLTYEVPAMPLTPKLPIRPPVLCQGCPHHASFMAVKEATQGIKAVYSGDIGCYTLGNTLDMNDTCLCMGAGVTIAQGLQRVEPDVTHFAFIGDSTFFHTGIPGVVNAVWNRTEIIIVVLDNSTTAMTGNQPHPGLGLTMMGETVKKISIYDVVKAIGVDYVTRANPYDKAAANEAVRSAMEHSGVRVILFEAPCVKIKKGEKA